LVEAALSTMTEIRWHARAGQGAVTAAKITAEAALAQGMHFQAFPEYGPERTGAPIQAFTRLANEPIRIHSNVETPEVVAVLDPTLLGMVDVTHGMPDDGIIIVNTDTDPAAIRATGDVNGGQLYTIDASAIALETIGRPMPNTPMLGALVRATGLLDLDNLLDDLRKTFSKKFSDKIVQGNVDAVSRAYDEVISE